MLLLMTRHVGRSKAEASYVEPCISECVIAYMFLPSQINALVDRNDIYLGGRVQSTYKV